ncbi:Antibacterial peptide PMAP-23 [Camelus dromedarius]|uniref:Antibacterial peptide PMAP-23 n=1 Tax=Camelus dromedarius TaxID=9838 RepID=A0A5N4CYY1_CAMDR|nr:Antibacterial peptide PMAP-23 [Camelus dromedarius]
METQRPASPGPLDTVCYCCWDVGCLGPGPGPEPIGSACLELWIRLNEQSSDPNLYRLLELDLPPKADEDPDAPKPVSFTVKETVCPRRTQQPPEQCDFKENGVVKQCVGTVTLDQSRDQQDITCDEVSDPFQAAEAAAGSAVPWASAQALSYREAVLRAVDRLNEQSSDPNLYRLLELDLPPKADEDPDAPKPVSFTVKETVCPKRTQLPPEQCDFKEKGVVKQCLGTVNLYQLRDNFDITCNEVSDPFWASEATGGGGVWNSLWTNSPLCHPSVPWASAQALSYREAVLRAVDRLNEQSSDPNLYRLLELDLPPKADEDPDAPKPVSFTVKETVCPKRTQLPPEQCDFKENGVVKQCLGTVNLYQLRDNFDITCNEVSDPFWAAGATDGGGV